MPIEFAVVPHPDEIARAEALRRHGAPATLGRLDDLGAWVAACQGQYPPRPLRRMRIVVFAGDHGIAARGVSAEQPGTTTAALTALREGGGMLSVLAEAAGATVRCLDLAVDRDDDGVADAEFKVRRSSGAIDVEDALTAEQAEAAVEAGMRVADAEVDAGADLLIPAELGVGVSTPASTLVATLTDTEPVAVIGRGAGIDDATWMRKAVAVRDAMRRAHPVVTDPVGLLRTVGGADLAAMAGFLAQAAVRRTPVLLDGLAVAAAALVAEELAPGARSWWVAAHRSTEPAQVLALDHLDLEPIVDLGIRVGRGAGAAATLPLLATAVRLLAEKAS
ncbi:nicotinate-nucleotide--dimethylbenzimidazole phosphoribosyltransferase [Saccharomonospora sp. NPDC046836]|uniref:nicotinate-nucleotide--dimethylbenzimidazole phosphoribosyltransferase n=1 Tax=Saccharomonospora sp. NPDC046836 TaxID=3156921 RepID=UPI003400C39F